VTGSLLLILAAAAAFALLAALELRRPDRRRLAGRLAASAIAIGALLALAAAPAREVTRSSETIVVATEGASEELLGEAADSARGARIVRLGDSIADAGVLRRRFPAAGRVIVAGWGLDDGDLARLARVAIDYRAAPLPAGVVALDFPARIDLGETATIAGSAGSAGWVRLDDGTGPVDSVRLDSSRAFRLRHRPRAAGTARYVVRAGDAPAESLGIDVVIRPAPAVLVVEAMPRFETSRLRDWLARRGGAVMVRTTISRGRTRIEEVNRRGGTERITPALLAAFDLVVADGQALAALRPAEREAIERAVRETRLGVLLRADEGLAAAGGTNFARFGFARVAEGAERATPIRWSGPGGSSRTEVTAALLALREGFAVSTIARDGAGRPVVQWRPVGIGRVGVSLVETPSRWLLAGDRDAYDGFWSLLVSALGRPRSEWAVEGAAPAFVDHPLVIARSGERRDHAVIEQPDGSLDTAYLAPAIDSSRWAGTWRPRLAGRHRVLGPDTAAFDVRGAGEWPALRAARRSAATTRAALASARHGAGGEDATPTTESVPIPPLPFFLAFVVSAGWLWWERRATAPAGQA
jgi:hypothetical protein